MMGEEPEKDETLREVREGTRTSTTEIRDGIGCIMPLGSSEETGGGEQARKHLCFWQERRRRGL